MRTRLEVTKSSDSFEGALEHFCLRHDSAPPPPLEAHQVEVEVKACCINYPDLMQTTNSYQHKQRFPYTPGLELSGVVVRTGSNCALQVGTRVMAMNSQGGLSSHLVLDENQCFKMPEQLTFAQGAAFCIGYQTAYHCLVERAQLQTDDVVLVNGATGGMGLAAAQLAKQVFGCTVIATGGSDEKLEVVARASGADHVINYSTDKDFSKTVKDVTGGKGVTVVFDSVGGHVFDQGLRSTAFGARVLVVGFTSGERPKIPANYVLIKCLTVLGCRAGEVVVRAKDGENLIQAPRWARLLHFASKGWLQPHVCAELPFTEAGVRQAYTSLMDRKVVGRVCVVMERQSNL
ncbi:Quinone oxidoreductase-like protein 2 [Durusdinium trenchii]|uniref:Quinone oxidoreductase-like protein 2 n=1 Tax=Durusdinium trenchii TaxID=1381693 RepID=A0ABP0IZ84_9DINO